MFQYLLVKNINSCRFKLYFLSKFLNSKSVFQKNIKSIQNLQASEKVGAVIFVHAGGDATENPNFFTEKVSFFQQRAHSPNPILKQCRTWVCILTHWLGSKCLVKHWLGFRILLNCRINLVWCRQILTHCRTISIHCGKIFKHCQTIAYLNTLPKPYPFQKTSRTLVYRNTFGGPAQKSGSIDYLHTWRGLQPPTNRTTRLLLMH